MGWAAPVLFVVDPVGRLHINLLAIEGPEDREAAAHAARDIIRALGGGIYVTVAEVWGKAVPLGGGLGPAELADEMLGLAGRVHSEEGREERILILGGSRTGEHLSTEFLITRDAAGRGSLKRQSLTSGKLGVGAWTDLFEDIPTPEALRERTAAMFAAARAQAGGGL
jgi:hypothetical protein